MHRSLFVLPALLALPLAGCVVGLASGQPYSETLRGSYANFDRVDVSAGVETVVSQGPFDVTAEVLKGNGFDNLIVEVAGDTLRISRRPQMFNPDQPHYRVTVSAPTYRQFDASSGSRLEGSNLSLKEVIAEASSGASMSLTGACTTLELNVSSGASFEGESLRCEAARVNASSGASASAYATLLADGDASSGGSVSFHGRPTQIRKESSSGGSVQLR